MLNAMNLSDDYDDYDDDDLYEDDHKFFKKNKEDDYDKRSNSRNVEREQKPQRAAAKITPMRNKGKKLRNTRL